MMEKMYLVSESKLRNLIHNTLTVIMLIRAGINNWMFCGSEYDKIIREYFPNATEEELDELEFEDCVDIILKDYCEVER